MKSQSDVKHGTLTVNIPVGGLPPEQPKVVNTTPENTESIDIKPAKKSPKSVSTK